MNKTKIIVGIVIFLLVGYFVNMEYKKYQLRLALEEVDIAYEDLQDVLQVDPTDTTIIDKEPKNEYTKINKAIGEEVILTTIKLKVNSTEEKQIVTRHSQPKIAREGAKFIVTHISIINILDVPFSFNDLILIDNDNKQYHSIPFLIEDSLEYRKISPGLLETGYMVFEIPETSTSYSLFVGKAGTKYIYMIELK